MSTLYIAVYSGSLKWAASIFRNKSLVAIDLRQHLFDTLYHAVALETPGASLITADDKYFASAASRGGIVRLSEWQES